VFGAVQALQPLPSADQKAGVATTTPLAPLWEIALDDVIFATLMPLPDGGVVLAMHRRLIGLSPAGRTLWEGEAALLASHWVLARDHLVLAEARGEIWLLDREGAVALGTEAGGRLALADGKTILTYDEQGLHRLYLETGRMETIYPLLGGFPAHSDLILLQPDALYLPGIAAPGDRLLTGSDILATHRDADGESLIVLASDGTLRWRRSYASKTRAKALRTQQELLSLDGRAYLFSRVPGLSCTEITLYEIDVERAELIPLFVGGHRDPAARDTWLAPVGDGRFLIHVGGVGLALLDAQAAAQAR
jgi:hypothetical protein